MSLPYNGKLIARARELRSNPTPQEDRLWTRFLCDHAVRFQRQKVIGSYIVDFYCHAAKLVIELDGSHHYEENAKLYDEERTHFLSAFGLRVIRFSNSDVDHNFADVCQAIDEAVQLSGKNASSSLQSA